MIVRKLYKRSMVLHCERRVAFAPDLALYFGYDYVNCCKMESLNDLFPTIASHLSLVDAIRFGSTCKLAQEIVNPCLAHTRRLMEEKMSQSAHPDFMYPGKFSGKEGRVHVDVVEWSRPSFGLQEARKCFEKRQICFTECVDPRHIRICAYGTSAQVDETIRKLSLWMKAECDAVVSLHVASRCMHTSGMRNCFKDEHLKPFQNARNLCIYECDNVTDDAILQFTNMDWLMVDDCRGLSGNSLEKLVTEYELRHISWYFNSLFPPHSIVTTMSPTMSPTMDHYVQSGALRFDISLTGYENGKVIERKDWTLGTPYANRLRRPHTYTPE
jgi:hypothetical protein